MAIRGLPPQNKRRLKDVVPLDTPYTVLISVTDYCNIKCVFCPYHGPAGKHAYGKHVMSLEYFKSIIDELAKFPRKLCRLTFSGFGEPTLHKELPDMINYAKTQRVADEIMLATNGIMLKPGYNRRLKDAGLDYIRISVPAIDSQTAFAITGHALNIDGYIENIRDLYTHKTDMIVLCKTTNIALGGKGGTDADDVLSEKFHQMFHDVCDYSFVENIAPWAGTNEDTLTMQGLTAIPSKDMNGRSRQKRCFCEFLFYMLAIDSIGNLWPCCSSEAPRLGKVGAGKSIVEIWNSEHVYNIRMTHLAGQIEVCAECGVNNFIDTQNIDADVEIIRSRMTENR